MTASSGMWIPFANPIEIFAVGADGVIDYTGSYKAVCRQLTADGMDVLQTRPDAPTRMVIGVHCEGHVFFLPATRLDVGSVGGGVYELQTAFTTLFDPKGPPPKIEFIPEEEVAPWVSEMHDRRAPGHEKRQHERAVYNEEIDMDGPGANRPAFALNLSEGGIALITTYLLAVGEVRLVRLPQPDGAAVRKKMRIVRCTEIIPRIYEVGGQFLPD